MKRKAYRATMRIVIWDNPEKMQKVLDRRKTCAACCCEANRREEKFGPLMVELHFSMGLITVGKVAHEIKMGEVAAYRFDRIIETIGQELKKLGLAFDP